MSLENWAFFQSRSTGEWVHILTPMILINVQVLLEGDEAPTIEDMMGLDPIGESYLPGVYVGLIVTDILLHVGHDFVYVGSGTGQGNGLKGQTDMHLDPVYRERQRAGPGSFHYNIVDQPNRGRVEHFRKLVETEFTIRDPSHINEIRFACILLEHILAGWLRSFTLKSISRWSSTMSISPWDTAPYLGTNCRPPLLEKFHTADSAVVVLTREEYLVRAAQIAEVARRNKTDLQRQAQLAQKRDYNRRVNEPVLAMRKAGADEEDIKAFQTLAKAEYNEYRGGFEANARDLAGKSTMETLYEMNGELDTGDLEHLELVPGIVRGKRGSSCLSCYKWKVRCTGGPPCDRCKSKALKCEPRA